ncbi:MAG: EamA family transporter [Deltaproteobacteria bacterium]|nr:EamA family transporter [Deltaproteobacteria bacterium]
MGAATVLILLAAILHASWNAVIRSEGDRLRSMTVLCAAQVVVCIPILLLLPPVSAVSAPYICASIAIHVAYCYFLVRSYDLGELADVYPIARGSSPVLVALFAWAVVGETLGAPQILGIVFVSVGIVGMVAFRTSPDRSSLVAAFTTGCLIASYSVIDGIGARASQSPIAYVGWLCVGEGVAMVMLHRALRGAIGVDFSDMSIWKPVGGAVLAMASYGIVVWAMTITPMGPVSALRETSVMFAALIARFALGEPLGVRRAACCGFISLGAASLTL